MSSSTLSLPRTSLQGTLWGQGARKGALSGKDSVKLASPQYLALCPVLGHTLGRGGRPVPVSHMERRVLTEGLAFFGETLRPTEPGRSHQGGWPERQEEAGQPPDPPWSFLFTWTEDSGVLISPSPSPTHVCLQMGT